MGDFTPSNSFVATVPKPRQSNCNLNELEILKDVVRSLQNSKYSDKYFLRGGFVLMGLLLDKGCMEYERQTTDIDMDFISADCWEELVSEISEILTKNSRIGAVYHLTRRRGFNKNPTGDSLSFKAECNGLSIHFKIDMNIRKFGKLVSYTMLDFVVHGTDSLEMLCDKISVLSQKKVCRRIKDLYDVYVLAHVCNFKLAEFVNVWGENPRTIGEPIYILEMSSVTELAHAYKKFMGIVNKPIFEQVYRDVLKFCMPIFDVLLGMGNSYDIEWSSKTLIWS